VAAQVTSLPRRQANLVTIPQVASPITTSAAPHPNHALLPPEAFWTANTVVDQETGTALEYRHLCLGPDSKKWLEAAENEIGRLAQGFPPRVPTGTNMMHFIPHTQLPPGRYATYLRIVAAIKAHKAKKECIRFTVGGNRIPYP
jgi:hypothetical protein